MAQARPRFGYHRMHTVLRRERWRVNKKRVRRLTRLEGLPLHMRVKRRKPMALRPWPCIAARCSSPQVRRSAGVWAVCTIHLSTYAHCACSPWSIAGDRQSPLFECDFSLTDKRAVNAVEHHVSPTKLPQSRTVDHGTAFTSKAVEAWACYRGVQLDFTRPGKPTDNRPIESLYGR